MQEAWGNKNILLPHTPHGIDSNKNPGGLRVAKLAYKQSLETGVYIDTRFFAYSRRKPDGTVFAPRAVYANSWILRANLSSYFEPRECFVQSGGSVFITSSVLRGGYQTTFDSLDSQFPAAFKSETDEYDYDSDSDIDGDEEGDENLPKSASIPETPAMEEAVDVSTPPAPKG